MIVTRTVIFLVINQFLCLLLNLVPPESFSGVSASTDFYSPYSRFTGNDSIQAVNDTFHITINCDTKMLIGNVMTNDVHGQKEIEICYIFSPTTGVLYFGGQGLFNFYFPERFEGKVEFSYGICEKGDKESRSDAKVTVFVSNDYDCDGVSDSFDLDNDNDGILNIDEGDGLLDSDEDGIPDSFDIDSDNDGISDNEEWQHEGEYLKPMQEDSNANGWDDAYDVYLNGNYYEPEDTDKNGIPDYLDIDADNDGFSDKTEGFDTDGDGFADIKPLKSDADRDGLDDAFDIVSCWSLGCNSTGSCSPLPDNNKNGIRDWRESFFKSDEDGNSKLELTEESNIFIYPNPSTGSFNVVTPDIPEDEIIVLQICSIDGRTILSKKIFPGDNSIYSGINIPGTYVVKVQTNYLHFQRLIIIQ